MEYFRLEHPVDKVILCDDSVCNEIADYLELDEEDHALRVRNPHWQ
jgi:hypothetical protein